MEASEMLKTLLKTDPGYEKGSPEYPDGKIIKQRISKANDLMQTRVDRNGFGLCTITGPLNSK